MQELVGLSLQELTRRNSGPRFDHLGDFCGANLLSDHRLFITASILSFSLSFRLGNLALNRGDLAVLEATSLFPATLAHGQIQLSAQRIELNTQVTDAVVTGLFGLPAGSERTQRLLAIRQVGAQLAQAILGGLVEALRIGLGQVGLLHTKAIHATAQLVDLDRRGVELHAQARRGLVDQVDGLVGQLSTRDVAVRQGGRGDKSTVGDGHLVVRLVLRGDTTQDGDGILDRGLTDEHLLEATLQRGVLLDVLAVLVERGRADHAQLTAGEHGLEHVARVHCALGAASRTDDRVQLIDEGDDLTVGTLNLSEDGLQALLELTAILRASNHRRHVEGDQALVAQGFRDIAGNDALGEAFDDGRLTNAGLTDQNRVVLGTTRQDLDDATNLVISPDDRVELAFAGNLREVAAVLGQGLEGSLGVGRGNRVGAQLRERLRESVGTGSTLGEDSTGLGLRGGQSDEQVLGRNVLVTAGLGALASVANDREQRVRGLSTPRGGALRARESHEGVAGARTNRAHIGANSLEKRQRNTFALLNESFEQVDGLHLRVSGRTSSRERRGDGLLRLCCHFTCHEITPPNGLSGGAESLDAF